MTQHTPARAAPAATSLYPRALAVVTAAQLLLVVNVAMVFVAIPRMQAALQLSVPARGLVTAGYAAAIGSLLLCGGRIVDRIGHRRALVIGLTFFAAAAALGGAAHQPWALLIARIGQGAAGALIAPAALAVIPAAFSDPVQRRQATDLFGGVSALGITLGIGLGGLLTQYASWRWCLWTDVPAALLLAVLASRDLPASVRQPVRRRLGAASTLLLAGGLGLLLLTGTAREPLLAGTGAVLALVLLAGFFVAQNRSSDPLVPGRVVRHGPRTALYLISLLVNASQFAVLFFLTFYFQSVLGFGPGHSALLFLPFTLAILGAAVVCMATASRVSARTQMAAGAGLAALGLVWLTRLDGTADYVTQLLPAEIAVGAGLAAVLVPLAAAVQPGPDVRTADSLVTVSHEVGGALGIVALNAIFLNLADPGGQLRAYHAVFACGAALFAGAMAVALLPQRSQ